MYYPCSRKVPLWSTKIHHSSPNALIRMMALTVMVLIGWMNREWREHQQYTHLTWLFFFGILVSALAVIFQV